MHESTSDILKASKEDIKTELQKSKEIEQQANESDMIRTSTKEDENNETEKGIFKEKNQIVKTTENASSEVIESMTKKQKRKIPDKDDAYLIDYSALMNLPRSVIQEAIEYAKKQRRLTDQQQEEEYIRLKCIPPWAKSYGTEHTLAKCVTTATQYDFEEEKKDRESSEPKVTEAAEIVYKKSIEKGKIAEGAYSEESEHEESEGETGEEITKDKSGMLSIGLQMKPSTEAMGMQTDDETEQITPRGEEGGKKQEKKEKEILEEKSIHSGKVTGITDEKELDLSQFTSKEKMKLAEMTALEVDLSDLTEEQRQEVAAGELTAEELEEISLKKEEDVGHVSELTEEEEKKEDEGTEKKLDEETEQKLDEETEKELDEDTEKKLDEEIEMKLSEGVMEEEKKIQEGKAEEGEEEELTTSSDDSRIGQDTEYLKAQLGRILAISLAEIAWKRPADPVHYLAHRLYNARKQQQIQEQRFCEKSYISTGSRNPRVSEVLPVKKFDVIRGKSRSSFTTTSLGASTTPAPDIQDQNKEKMPDDEENVMNQIDYKSDLNEEILNK